MPLNISSPVSASIQFGNKIEKESSGNKAATFAKWTGRKVKRSVLTEDRVIVFERLPKENSIRKKYHIGMAKAIGMGIGVPVVGPLVASLVPVLGWATNAALTDNAWKLLGGVTAVGIGSRTARRAGNREEALTGKMAEKESGKVKESSGKESTEATNTVDSDVMALLKKHDITLDQLEAMGIDPTQLTVEELQDAING